VNIAQIQPWPIYLKGVGVCCNHYDRDTKDAASLYSCVNQSITKNYLKNKEIAKVAIVSYISTGYGHQFAIPDIVDFAAYHMGITQAYAEHNGYIYKVVDSVSSSSSDPRWNKIQALMDALDPVNGYAKDMELIM
jgi:hypothetical protein